MGKNKTYLKLAFIDLVERSQFGPLFVYEIFQELHGRLAAEEAEKLFPDSMGAHKGRKKSVSGWLMKRMLSLRSQFADKLAEMAKDEQTSFYLIVMVCNLVVCEWTKPSDQATPNAEDDERERYLRHLVNRVQDLYVEYMVILACTAAFECMKINKAYEEKRYPRARELLLGMVSAEFKIPIDSNEDMKGFIHREMICFYRLFSSIRDHFAEYAGNRARTFAIRPELGIAAHKRLDDSSAAKAFHSISTDPRIMENAIIESIDRKIKEGGLGEIPLLYGIYPTEDPDSEEDALGYGVSGSSKSEEEIKTEINDKVQDMAFIFRNKIIVTEGLFAKYKLKGTPDAVIKRITSIMRSAIHEPASPEYNEYLKGLYGTSARTARKRVKEIRAGAILLTGPNDKITNIRRITEITPEQSKTINTQKYQKMTHQGYDYYTKNELIDKLRIRIGNSGLKIPKNRPFLLKFIDKLESEGKIEVDKTELSHRYKRDDAIASLIIAEIVKCRKISKSGKN